MKLSVIVPCYNEQAVLLQTHARLTQVLANIGMSYEIIYVDDGSQDETKRLIKQLCDQNTHAKGLILSRNFGHQVAVSAGLEEAQGDAVILIDADLQDPPEVIHAFIAQWREGYEVVYGQRRSREGETAFKLITANLFYRLINKLSEVEIPLNTGDFRLMDRKVVNALLAMPERHRLLRAMTSWVGFNQISVPYDRCKRWAGESKYPLKKMLNLAIDGIVSFSTIPLRLITLLGTALFALSVCAIFYALIMRLFTQDWVPGWTLMFIALMGIGGMQFMCIGVLGEYIGRIYSETKGRPLYFVSEKLGFAHKTTPSKDKELSSTASA
ncbi:MAG TPA: glycosyltransferase family 2 protein [Opitutales bacterium]|nr:glycosyltransferase family 2 protein [Opitutales bacterium]